MPFSLVSISLYLGLIVFGNSTPIWLISTILGLFGSFMWLKRFRSQSQQELLSFLKNKTNLLLVIMIFSVIAITGFSVSPFIITKKIDNFEHIQLTDVGDYYKHTYIVNQIAKDGFPPQNPYFPKAKLSYYFGYYLLPALIVRLSQLPGALVTFWYILLTNTFSLLSIAFLIGNFIKRPLYRFMAIGLVLSGLGVDAIAFVFNTHGQLQNDEGLQLINVYKSLLFAPQHFLAASITVWTVYQLLYKKSSALLITLFSTMVLLTSLFVSITLIIWLSLIFIFKKHLRVTLIKSGLLTGLILIPYLLLFNDRNNLFYRFTLDPYNATPYYSINVIYTFFIKYGPFVFLTPFLLVFKPFRQPLYIASYFLILAVTWFIRTPTFNDFSMRTSIPIWLSLPIVVFAVVDKYSKRSFVHIFLVILAVITIGIGAKGLYLETKKHYQSREFMNPSESELIQRVRSLSKETSLSSVDNAKWVELIPSLASKGIISPYLYDSYAYFTGKFGQEHKEYEDRATAIFHQETIGRGIKDVIASKNQQLDQLFDFFSRNPADLLILNNKIWVKKDTNPWVALFRQLDVSYDLLTPYYTAFHHQDLLEKLTQNQISINPKKITPLVVFDQAFNLQKGLWFLASCNALPNTNAKLEPNDYYLLFDETLTGNNRCVGRLFYLEETKRLTLTQYSKVETLYAAPVEIIPVK